MVLLASWGKPVMEETRVVRRERGRRKVRIETRRAPKAAKFEFLRKGCGGHVISSVN